MKHNLFYLSSALIVWAILIGLALCLLGYLPVLPYLVWAIVALFIVTVWWVAVSDKDKK